MTFDSVKDDGKPRVEFAAGGVREDSTSKKCVDLIPAYSIRRLGRHFQNGAKKYAPRQWEKGLALSTFIDSLKRHLDSLEHFDQSEDHEAAIAWNIMCYMWTKRMIEVGKLPQELDDVSETFKTNILLITELIK